MIGKQQPAHAKLLGVSHFQNQAFLGALLGCVLALHDVCRLDGNGNCLRHAIADHGEHQIRGGHIGKAPQAISLRRLREALNGTEARITQLKPDPRSLMSDLQLAEIYPPRSLGEPSFAVAYRSYWWSVIEPIVRDEERYFSGLFPLSSLIMPRVRELGISKQRIYLVLYRYWAAGSVISAILPNSSNCGGKGKQRAGNKTKLGRKSLVAKRNQAESSNFALTKLDIENLQFGWRTYVTPGVRVEAAYDRMIRTFYTSHWEQRNGKPHAIPIPKDERPAAGSRYQTRRKS